MKEHSMNAEKPCGLIEQHEFTRAEPTTPPVKKMAARFGNLSMVAACRTVREQMSLSVVAAAIDEKPNNVDSKKKQGPCW
eukprot:scaffold3059_cov131-Amphora_coffeaeformis.AAC.3